MRGSMTERRPGVWRLRVFTGNDPVTGAKRYASKTFSGTERQAETALARFVTEADQETPGSPTITLAGLLDAYCDHAENVGRSPTTVFYYRRQAENLRAGVGRTPLAKLKPQQLDELYAVLGERGVRGGRGALSPASVNRYHALISAALRQAIKWGWIDKNPAARATPPTEPRPKMSAPSPVELRKLIDRAANGRQPANALLIAIAAVTGARRGELAALRLSDLDLDDGVIHFRRAVKQVGRQLIVGDTKTHAERSVALPASGVSALRSYWATVVELSASTEIPIAVDPYVFSSTPDHGRPLTPSGISQAFRRTATACGLPYHLHQLRHFAATQAIAAGFDPVAVAARLGHADPSVTLRVYSHALEDRDRALGEALGDLVSPPAQIGEAK